MQTPLEAGRIAYEKKREEKETLLDVASRHASEQGVRAMASAIVAHNIPSAILSAAEMESPDFILMGWKGEAKIPQLRRTNVADVLRLAKGNVLVLKDRGIESVGRILVPWGGGPHAQLGLVLARELALEWNASVTTLKVQVGRGISEDSSDFERQSVAIFKKHTEEYGKDLLDAIDIEAEMRVEIGEDIAHTIVKTSEDFDLIVMGASNEWALRQRLFGSLPDQVADHATVSVLMVRAKQ
jgi:nucleotide-binding universal stress UspA family protein